jgi:type IV pilus assembly protein PilY1
MEAVRYFRGMPVYWGRARGGQQSYDRYSRVSHMASHTGGVLNQPSGCTSLDLNSSSCINETVGNGPVYQSPIVDACQANYIVLLSDGFQNTYSSADGIQSLISTAPDPKFASCSSADGGANCGLELAEFAHRFDQRSDLTGDQTITTFAIGFAFSSTFLEDMGKLGGGQYKTASSAAELISAFDAFLGDILSRPTTFTAPTLTISAFNRLFNSNEIYISLFEPERSASWSGNVKKYFLCTPAQDAAGTCTVGQLLDANNNDAAENGQIVTSAVSDWGGFEDGPDVELGGTGAQVPGYATRRVYTYTGTNSNLANSANLIVNSNAAITSTMLGTGTAAERTDLIQWIRGQDMDDVDSDGSTTDQRWSFGDPLHSAAVTVNYGISSGNVPITKLFVGTNDGGFRMVNTYSGEEEWIFIPRELLGLQKQLRDNPNGDHLYGMDGSPIAWILDNDGDGVIEPTADPTTNDFVKLIIGQRRGGHNYYAVDVSPASALSDPAATGSVAPQLLWHIYR